MDVAKSQVMIEAKIVEVGSNYSESLGIRWEEILEPQVPVLASATLTLLAGHFL